MLFSVCDVSLCGHILFCDCVRFVSDCRYCVWERKFLRKKLAYSYYLKVEKNFGFKNMKITKKKLRELIIEELTADDKSEIKKIASKEAEELLKSKKMKDMVAQEVEKSLDSAASKEQIGDITKKVLKKLYKDLSLQHPYIIDRIKV